MNSPGDGQVPSAATGPRDTRLPWRRLLDFVFGYDFFISYAWSDGGKYAAALASQLEAGGFKVFLDRTSYAAGDNWKSVGTRTLRGTGQLLLIGSPQALTSTPVLHEVEIFSATGRRIVPIDFGGSLDWPSAEAAIARLLPADIIRIKEPSEALEHGPASDTVSTIQRTFTIVRQNRKRARALFIVAASLLTLAAAAVWSGFTARNKAQEALLQQARSVSVRSRQATDSGDGMTGMLAALAVLPDPSTGRVRPDSTITRAALLHAWLHNREVAGLFGHSAAIVNADISPDARRAATASGDGQVKLWNLSSPLPTGMTLEGHKDNVTHLEFSPDGQRLLTASDDRTARVWDLSGPQPTAIVLEGHTDTINDAHFSQDERRVLTTSQDGTARVWDLSRPQPSATVLQGAGAAVTTASFDADGVHVVTVTDDAAQVWDLSGPKPKAATIPHGEDKIVSAAISATGRKVVTISNHSTICIWDSSSLLSPSLTFSDRFPTSAAFSPDARYLVTTSFLTRAVQLWDLTVPQPKPTLLEGQSIGMAMLPNELWVLNRSSDSLLRAWRISGDRPAPIELGRLPEDLSERIVAFNIDKRLVVARDNNMAAVIDFRNQNLRRLFLGLTRFSRDGRKILVTTRDNVSWVWNFSGTQPTVAVLEGQEDIWDAVFSPDGLRLVTVSSNRTVRYWDLSSSQPTAAVLEQHTARVDQGASGPDGLHVIRTGPTDESASKRIVFSADGLRVVTAVLDNAARVYDLSGPQPTAMVLQGHSDAVTSASFSSNGRLVVTTSRDRTARVWDLSSPKSAVRVLERHTDWVERAEFSANGRWVMTASRDGTALLWDLPDPQSTPSVLGRASVTIGPSLGEKGEQEKTIGYPVANLSKDGRQLVAASDDTNKAWVWDLSNPRPSARALDGSDRPVRSAEFSDDGRRVVTTSRDGSVRVWDLASRQPTATVLAGPPALHAMFSPDGRRVVASSSDGTAWIWELSDQPSVATQFVVEDVKRFGPTRVMISSIKMKFSADGQRLLTTSHSDSLGQIFEIPSQELLIGRVKASLTRCLSLAQEEALGVRTSPPSVREQQVTPEPPCQTRD